MATVTGDGASAGVAYDSHILSPAQHKFGHAIATSLCPRDLDFSGPILYLDRHTIDAIAIGIQHIDNQPTIIATVNRGAIE